MANCDICEKKLAFMGGNTMQKKVGNISIGPSITVCEDCENLLNRVKDGDIEAYETVCSYAKERNDRVLNSFIDEWSLQSSAIVMYRNRDKIKRETEMRIEEENTLQKMSKVIVTTCDLHQDYEVIGPVYFQLSSKNNSVREYIDKYSAEIAAMIEAGTMSRARGIDLGFLIGEWDVGQDAFEPAFFIAVQELRRRTLLLGGDAVIGMRQDIDIDTHGFAYFYLQMYGTAVKLK